MAPARGRPTTNVQAVIAQLLANGAAQADIDALVAAIPQGDANEGLARDTPDDMPEAGELDSSASTTGADMGPKLLPSASNWKGDVAISCYFTATADGSDLFSDDDQFRTNKFKKPVYTIQDGTKEVQVTATPGRPPPPPLALADRPTNLVLRLERWCHYPQT